jgi:uncharacterized membrane protein
MTIQNKSRVFLKTTIATLTFFLSLSAVIMPFNTSAKEKPGNSASAVVTYPVADFADGKARHFQYKTPKGKTVRYFIVRSSDGVIRAAFDACDVCWPAGKGYYQEGDIMVCRNCGRKFPSNKVNVVTGGCNPGALNRQVTQTQVIIQVKDILEGERYYNF